ncbi:hypothetical protein [Micromonospora sp. NPDC093244]
MFRSAGLPTAEAWPYAGDTATIRRGNSEGRGRGPYGVPHTEGEVLPL